MGVRISSAGGFSLQEDLGFKFEVWVWVLELGFGVYISQLRFRFRRTSAPTLSSPAGWLLRLDLLCFGSQGLMFRGSSARTCVSGGKVQVSVLGFRDHGLWFRFLGLGCWFFGLGFCDLGLAFRI